MPIVPRSDYFLPGSEELFNGFLKREERAQVIGRRIHSLGHIAQNRIVCSKADIATYTKEVKSVLKDLEELREDLASYVRGPIQDFVKAGQGQSFPLFSEPVMVLDTETTGLTKDAWARVVEIAAVVLDEFGNEIGSFTSLLRPDVLDRRAIRALECNGLSDALLLNAPEAQGVLRDFRAWYESAKMPLVVAFTQHDKNMLGKTGVDWLRWDIDLQVMTYEIMSHAGALTPLVPGDYHYSPDRPWKFQSVEETAKFLGIDSVGERHRALPDARLEAQILIRATRYIQEGRDDYASYQAE